MGTYIAILAIIIFLILLIKGILNARNVSESKLSAYEHPSTFKKPEIEMVNSNIDKNETNNESADPDTLNYPDTKEED